MSRLELSRAADRRRLLGCVFLVALAALVVSVSPPAWADVGSPPPPGFTMPGDTDGDGMPDGYEIASGLDPNDPSDADQDADGDGLTNVEEGGFGTDPNAPDTDGDGTPDGDEVARGYDPLLPPKGVLNESCTISVLNRTVRVDETGDWPLPNVPANTGLVRARATCIDQGVTISGQSDFFDIPENGTVHVHLGVGPYGISFDSIDPIPARLEIAAPSTTLSEIGGTLQVQVTATLPDGTTSDVTASSSGTNYGTSNAAIASVTVDGLVSAVSSGTVVLSARNEGAIGLLTLRVVLSGDSDGDGIPDDVELAVGLNPNDPIDALEDEDGDGLTNRQELVDLGTDFADPDTDDDGIDDGEEVVAGEDGFETSPLLPDSDGDGVRDGLEVASGSDPTDPASFDLAATLDSLRVSPDTFVLTYNTIVGEESTQLSVTGVLIDGVELDLTSTARGTVYRSSDLSVCSFGATSGEVFAGANGACTIDIEVGGFGAAATGTVNTFSPTALGFVPIPGFANSVDVSGDTAYVAAGAAGLQVVDVSDRAAPRIVTSVGTDGNANDVKIAGPSAFVAIGTGGLAIFDLSDPRMPTYAGGVDTPGTALDVAVLGDLVAIADASAGVQLVDVTNPAQPVIVGSATTSGTARGVAFGDGPGLLYVADGTGGVSIVEIADPAAAAKIGSVSTGGNAVDLVVQGAHAFVADRSQGFVVADIADPLSPEIATTLSRNDAGLLTDVAESGRFVLASDIFFVNLVPIVDVVPPTSPEVPDVVDFTGFRDDNGHGIAVDGAYVYLAAATGSSTQDQANGNSRLYVGQYLANDDTAGVPPVASILSPAPGDTVIEGQTLHVRVDASDDVAVAAVELLVDGVAVQTDTSEPYHLSTVVPTGVGSIAIGARAIDLAASEGLAAVVQLQVVPDPLTTAVGLVLGAGGLPVGGADVECLDADGTTGADGVFSISGLPTVRGRIRCTATFIDGQGRLQVLGSGSIAPVPGGITDVGLLTDAPIAESRFDTDTEGWRAVDNNSQPFFVADAGDPGGHVCVTDNRGGISVFYSAPEAFLGDASAAFGQALRLSMRRNSSGGSPIPTAFAILRGNGLSLSARRPDPVDAWRQYILPLDERGGWTVDGEGRAATGADILGVLAALDELLVHGEFRDVLSERSCLDSVVLGGADPLTTVVGVVEDASGLAVEGAAVDCAGDTTLSAVDGSFSLPGVPTYDGDILCTARFADGMGGEIATDSNLAPPLPGGTTDLGVLSPGAVASSSFDAGTEGWAMVTNNSGPFFVAAAGHPDGHICATDDRSGGYFFSAPTPYLGNVSRAYGRALLYSLKIDRTDSPFTAREVVLIGGGLTLTRDLPHPGVDWVEYAVVLDESGGWVVSGRAPTREEMLQVLGSLEQLRIRGEFRSGADTGCLDEVLFGVQQGALVAVTVDGRANVFGAGLASPPAPGGGGGGQLPALVELPFAEAVVTVVAAPGWVSGYASGCAYAPADGSATCGSTTHVSSVGGISGVRHDGKVMFLAGVFLDDAPPVAPAPPLLDETTADDRIHHAPLLGQTFHIGDGRAGSGAMQIFLAPAGATRLYLGFAEAFQFGGPTNPKPAGYYNDNGGSLDIVVDLE